MLGLIGTIFIILLSVTGILLLHTNEFNLQQRLVANGVILDWYDINPQQSPRSFRIADRWVIQLDEQVYLDRHAISATDEKLLGAINLEGIVVLGYENFIDLIFRYGRAH